MRIFQICPDSGIPFDGTKGASVHVRALADAFRRGGHEVHLFVANPGGAPLNEAPYPLYELRPGALEEAAARWGSPDLVYERYALGREAGMVFARKVGSPFALEVNAPLVLETARHRPQKLGPHDGGVERALFRQADMIAAVSEPLRKYVARIRGTDDGTVVARNGCDALGLRSVARLDGREPHTVVFLGHPKPWHGAEELPGVVAELRRRGNDVRLLIIGGGPGGDRVLNQARRNGVAQWVEVTGPLSTEAVARRLGEGTVAVAPYPPEPIFYFCPLKVMECMAAGLPVVTTAQGDLPEIVGEAGVAVAPGDLRAITDAVEQLLQNEPLRRSLGARARQRALSNFTWDHAAERVIRAANEITTARRRVA